MDYVVLILVEKTDLYELTQEWFGSEETLTSTQEYYVNDFCASFDIFEGQFAEFSGIKNERFGLPVTDEQILENKDSDIYRNFVCMWISLFHAFWTLYIYRVDCDNYRNFLASGFHALWTYFVNNITQVNNICIAIISLLHGFIFYMSGTGQVS